MNDEIVRLGRRHLKREAMSQERDNLIRLSGGKLNLVARGLALHIIINTIGSTFFMREVNKPSRYLTDSHARTLHLASALWRAQDCPGFEQWIKRAKNDDIEGAFFELFWLNSMRRLSAGVALNKATGKKGADYDFYMFGFEKRGRVNVEVKTRTEPLLDQKRARRFLDTARVQLPASQDGAIVFRLSSAETISQSDLDEAIRTTIRNSTRLFFIMYCWEVQLAEGAVGFSHAFVDANGRDDGRFALPTLIWNEEAFITQVCS